MLVKVGPFCRKGLRDPSRHATKVGLIEEYSDVVERLLAHGFARRRKSSPAVRIIRAIREIRGRILFFCG